MAYKSAVVRGCDSAWGRRMLAAQGGYARHAHYPTLGRQQLAQARQKRLAKRVTTMQV